MSRFLLVSLVAACVASSLGAQATTATLQGTVTTSDGTVLPGAEVVAWSREIGTAHVVFADSRGVYRLLGLDPGLYDVTARAVGFRALRQTGVELIVGDEATLDFVLEPGAVELDPVVVQAASSVPVERLNVSTPVLEREIERLPLNTRDVLALASIAPGVRTFAPEAGRSVPAAGALSTGRFVNLYVDGVEWKGLATGALVGAPGSGSLMHTRGATRSTGRSSASTRIAISSPKGPFSAQSRTTSVSRSAPIFGGRCSKIGSSLRSATKDSLPITSSMSFRGAHRRTQASGINTPGRSGRPSEITWPWRV